MVGDVDVTFAIFLGKIYKRECPHCGAYIKEMDYMKPCTYTSPCGHRLYNGTPVDLGPEKSGE